ncbi:MAG TPA: nucleotide sugar dehydrogenase [Longimicrobiales bacterium]|nr:nucleotide sugar dehydrogenase [Longimicrobiales bacterium]
MIEKLIAAIEKKEAKVGVVGLGYVGLPLAVELAKGGHPVLGFEIAESVCNSVNSGKSHIKDVTNEMVRSLVDAKKLEATTDMRRMGECDAISVCVPTPLGKTRDPDVSYVVAATEAIAESLRPGQLIILESTTYPGTTRDLMLPMLEARGMQVGHDFFLCFSPERVDPGNEVWQVPNTPKVLGGITRNCIDAAYALYSSVIERVVTVSSPEAAELAKLLENTFRAVNIALVNEMAQVCDRLHVNVFEVIEAAATKPFGFMKFTPGPGIGGHCIPLDPHYLAWKMKTLNYKTRMIELAGEVNAEMPEYVVEKIQDALNSHRKPINGSRILVLGVAYKRDIDDLRESPALDVIRLLEEKGAQVHFHDPHVPVIREEGYERESVALSVEELQAADCAVIITDHRAVDYETVVRSSRLVVDTRDATRGIEGGTIVGLSG